MLSPNLTELFRLFGLKYVFVLCVVGSVLLAAFGLWIAAGGFVAGCLLYVAKSVFHYEAGRSLIKAKSRLRAGAIAGLSSIARLLVIAICLVTIVRVSPQAFYAACGGLLLSQVSLHISSLWHKEVNACSNG